VFYTRRLWQPFLAGVGILSLLFVFFMYIPPLYSQSTVLVAASNQVFLILWAEIHYLCSLRLAYGL
jgi:hypothetical protein